MIENLAALTTEARNPATADLDSRSTADLVRALHACDQEAVDAVGRESERIAAAIDAIALRLERGGRLFYSGAGTSGRLGVLDASECPPTYNTPPEMVQGLIAGGDHALRHPVEGAEDDETQGRRDLETHGFSANDVLVGIAASGRTPYVLGGIAYARALGALTIGLSCVAGSRLAQAAELEITPVTGPEAVTGSTRMKAGTATKLVLNMLSTGALVRLGYVYGNLMVNVQPTNAKLRDRAARIVSTVTGLETAAASTLIEQAGSVKTAIVMHQLQLDRAAAEDRLREVGGSLRRALRQ
ncbi:N-acetylmuramic acid 6-phosphate etherase [Silvibacterium dinghuense]|uniref:N-acetylmuramic acid 6-phosphate etherase n=1 Tax=Silvibacterium dinghuense TaxID=1560006 RepID=A0A4Q1SJK9_9BACT|nr:N-acetylmuramic acid 6-phosphate etherase [Silvibacterium dinghuense]RXS97838.1 N-acetylmuramic acid 6-phosphate etherase [Silvibacterium dinghuense]GGH02353.1 N-acetylmuramic acid 6-phosphate etherase [Silvibacterium dinghuense]